MRLIKKKPEIEDAAGKVFRASSEIERGDYIPYDWIVSAGGYHRKQKEWCAFKRYLRKMFHELRGIILWCPEPNRGFKLATTDEQILLLNDKRQRKAMRQISKAVEGLLAVRADELNVQQQTTRWSRVERNKRSLREIRRNRKLDKLLG